MKTIWKFPLSNGSPQRIDMPKGAEILSIQQQGGMAQLWALVDSEQPSDPRYIEIYGTGQRIHESVNVKRKYLATFQQREFVWHVFELL